MKKSSLFQKIYLGLITVLMYLPIVLVVIYSFNESKISSIWGGFSLKWYESLFKDEPDFGVFLRLACRCDRHHRRCWLYQDPAKEQGLCGVFVHAAHYDTRNYTGYGIYGVF